MILFLTSYAALIAAVGIFVSVTIIVSLIVLGLQLKHIKIDDTEKLFSGYSMNPLYLKNGRYVSEETYLKEL